MTKREEERASRSLHSALKDVLLGYHVTQAQPSPAAALLFRQSLARLWQVYKKHYPDMAEEVGESVRKVGLPHDKT